MTGSAKYILSSLILLGGCGSYYPEPETGVHYISLIIVDTVEEVRVPCGNPKAVACAWGCTILATAEGWDKSIAHEVAHCITDYSHR